MDIEASPRLRVSKPRLVIDDDGFGGDFDIMPDGKRFVMVQLDTTPPPQQLELVQNWMRLLAQPSSR